MNLVIYPWHHGVIARLVSSFEDQFATTVKAYTPLIFSNRTLNDKSYTNANCTIHNVHRNSTEEQCQLAPCAKSPFKKI